MNTTMGQWRVMVGGEEQIVAEADVMRVTADLVAKHQGATPTVRRVDAASEAPVAEKPRNSDFGGQLVTDEAAKGRIVQQYDRLEAAGVSGIARDKTIAGYAPGTRMADVGYANQARRAQEHAEKLPLGEAAAALASKVEAEERQDVEIKAGNLAREIAVNDGRLTIAGLLPGEQAIRGLLGRLESPALRYVLGLRERVAAEVAKGRQSADREKIRADREKIAETLRHECVQNKNVALKLRTRRALADIFAVVSPEYTPADAPALVGEVLEHLPPGTRGTWSYCPVSTSWELRAHVWTPTPVDEQAVGEVFEGYASFRGVDNGTGRLRGGGGMTILACLNAGTYSVDEQGSSRTHRSRVMVDLDKMVAQATHAIEVLVQAWGTAREEVLDVPSGVSLEEAIPGFWSYLLRDQRSELAGILPGRSKDNAAKMTAAYFAERRDPEKLVRADLAQAWTRGIQTFEPRVRRAAEAAIGDFVVSDRPVRCDLGDE